jgi:cell division protein YceG involved in septum cleavage
MNIDFLNKKNLWGLAVALFVMVFGGYFFYALLPMSAQKGATTAVFEIRSGEGFYEVGNDLFGAGFIRSVFVFDVFLFFSGRMAQLKPGEYRLNRAMSVFAIADELTNDVENEVPWRRES